MLSFIGQFVYPVERERTDSGGGEEGIVNLASCMFHFVIEHKKLL